MWSTPVFKAYPMPSSLWESIDSWVMLMSGTGIPNFYSASPIYAKYIADLFLTELGINSTDTENIYNELIDMPLEKIMSANAVVQEAAGLVSFVPVVESSHPGNIIIDEDPYEMTKKGRGAQCPLIIGMTSAEGEFFRTRVQDLKVVEQVQTNSLLVMSPRHSYELPSSDALNFAEQVKQKYCNGSVTEDGFLEIITDTYFKYPAFKLARLRGASGGAPAYLYYYSYTSNFSVIQYGLGSKPYSGAAHVEDLTYIFRENMFLGQNPAYSPTTRDELIKDAMTDFVINFMNCSRPTCSQDDSWPPTDNGLLNFHLVQEPGVFTNSVPDAQQWDMIRFFDSLEAQRQSLSEQ